MKLTVLNVAYPFAPVGPDCVGGAEQVLSQLDTALMQESHRSIVVAAEGSKTSGTLIATKAPEGSLTDEKRQAAHREHLLNIEQALDRFDVDLIHFHGIDFHAYLPRTGVPALVTLHLPPGWYPPDIFRLQRPRTFLHCVSRSQRSACPTGADLLPEIENGVPLVDPPIGVRKRNLAMMMGRICPEKNFHAGLNAAAHAGVDVILAGCVFPYAAHEEYFREQMVPRLSRTARFIGPVDPRRKARLLAAARCLLVPSVAQETSSLVAMEALAAGTPVIAFRSGALPEIVEHGVTGFLVNDEQEMSAAIGMVDGIDPHVCRAIARNRFGLRRMIDRYFDVYHRLARAESCRVRTADRLRAADNETVRGVVPPKTTDRFSSATGMVRTADPTETCTVVQSSSARDAPIVEEVTTTSALEHLGPEWCALWAEDLRATPFQSPQWLIPWWRHIGRGALWTLALRDRSPSRRLVGVVPLYVFTAPGATKRQVFPLGIATTDYLDGIFAVGWESLCVESALAHLQARRADWDECEWPQLRPQSPLLSQPPPAAWSDIIEEAESCPVVELPASSDGLPATLPRNILQNLAYYRRRAHRFRTLRAEVADNNNLHELHEAWLRLHAARWSARAEAGVLSDDAVRRWHAEALPCLLELGVLRLHALRLDGRIIAACHVLASHGHRQARAHYYYLGGFDPAYCALSPGTLLVGHAIEEAVREGANEFDFLRGREAYKYLWGATDRPTYRRRLRHSGADGGVRDFTEEPIVTSNPGPNCHVAPARQT
jgi:CelD/BcsL family acetyltransferase involved in cellulose biosynthesis